MPVSMGWSEAYGQRTCWVNGHGQLVAIRSMTTDHLNNAVRFMERHVDAIRLRVEMDGLVGGDLPDSLTDEPWVREGSDLEWLRCQPLYQAVQEEIGRR